MKSLSWKFFLCYESRFQYLQFHLTGVETHDLPHGSPMPNQLSQQVTNSLLLKVPSLWPKKSILIFL